MKGCECVVEEIYLNPSEDSSTHSAVAGSICLDFQPVGILARVPGVSWRLPAEHLPPSVGRHDTRGLFLLTPATKYF
eukprot:13149244-Alexandrium_andersonii.AAC.1